jgi:apolipoprotein N-acyltransferase
VTRSVPSRLSLSRRASASHAVLCLALATASGLLYGQALAPRAPAAIAWVALVPLFLACRRTRPAVAAAGGVAFAVAASALLASWFPTTLERFFGASTALAWLGWLGLAALVSAPALALLCAWLAWREARAPVAPLAVGAAWLVAEWLRSYGPIPNPYALLATSQVETPFAQAADVVGVFGVGALVAAGNAVLAALVARLLLRDGPAPRLARDVALTALAVIATAGYGLWRESLPAPAGPSLRVAVVQPAPASDASQAPALDQLLALTEAARARGPALVFWPESALGFYLREPSPERDRLLAATTAAPELVVGGPHYRYAAPEPAHFTSAFLVREARIAGRYDKRRLVPFAEYAPLGGWLGGAARLAPGDAVRPLPARDAAIGAFLCAEVLFPDVARALARAGATVLSNPAKDDWFAAEAPAQHQLRAARFRAIENRRPLVRAASGGYSAVVDARGALRAVSAHGASALLVTDVAPSSAATLYQRLGFVVAPAAALVVVAASRRGRPT